MADEAARRRELRRRRILENAEERKKKIFGTTSNNNTNSDIANEKPDAAVEQDASPSPLNNTSSKDEGSVKDAPLEKDVPLKKDSRTSPLSTSRTSEPQNPVVSDSGPNSNESDLQFPSTFRAENGIESVPEIAEQLRNINSLLTAGGGGGGLSAAQTRKFNSSDVQPTPVVGALSTPIVPVILALFVCILLSVKLDYVVSSSIALPFLLFETHHLWCKRHVIGASSRGVGGLLGLALVLCGIQQSAIRKMTLIMTVFRCIFEDFSFYILTVVLWYWMVGLPGTVHVSNEFGEAETVRVTATDEEELFNNMEEF